MALKYNAVFTVVAQPKVKTNQHPVRTLRPNSEDRTLLNRLVSTDSRVFVATRSASQIAKIDQTYPKEFEIRSKLYRLQI